MSWIRTFSIQLIIGIIFLEVLSFIGSKAKLFIVNDTPPLYQTHGKSNILETFRTASYHDGRTEKEAWGAWRKENLITRQVRACFDVEISSNEIGARDISFKQLDGRNIILLGDSFAEGQGVEYSQTSQFLLEKKLGLNVLNFGTAGDFGPLQQYIIYKDLAKNYIHDSLLIFVLPANDFTDNDKSFWNNSPANRIRYRPYYSYQNQTLIPWYFPEAKPSENFENDAQNISGNIKSFIVNNLWLSNPLRTLSYLISKIDKTQDSYYLSATEEEQINMINAYSKVVEQADGKPVSFVIIPTQRDFRLLENNSKQVASQFWYQGLKQLASSSGGIFIDLADYRVLDTNKLFHSCDGHWSILGNKWAADIIANELLKSNK